MANYLLPHCRIPMILYRVVSPPLKHFRNVSPFITKESVSQKQNPLLGKCPLGLHDIWVQMVVPSFTTLFSQSACHELRYEGPTLRTVLINEPYEIAIFVVRPGVFPEHTHLAGVALLCLLTLLVSTLVFWMPNGLGFCQVLNHWNFLNGQYNRDI